VGAGARLGELRAVGDLLGQRMTEGQDLLGVEGGLVQELGLDQCPDRLVE
jgi:hypothetical protein